MSLLINYPLTGTKENIITDINEEDFKIISGSFNGNFDTSNGQGEYFVTNNINIIFGIPEINNYISIYNTSPWQIEFEICFLESVDYSDGGIFNITRPDDNGDISFSIYFNGYDNITTNKNIIINSKMAEIWHKYVIFVDQNIIKVKIDGIEQDKYSRSFYFDKYNMNLSIGTFNNNKKFGIKNIKVYYGEISAPSSVDYYHDTTASIIVRKASADFPLEVEIPFPYKQFTDMEFILSDTYKNFISNRYYSKIDSNHIFFSLDNVKKLNLNDVDELRFTFCHNKGFYSINKIEYNLESTSETKEYKIDSPFGELLDLNIIYKVFYDRKLLYPNNYKFSIEDGILKFNESFDIEDKKDIDIIIFYTGNKINNAVSTLPMSGYITLKKYEIDRNYNKNLMGIFVNGKLVDKDNIIDMSNNIHKISKDIKSRYNVEVKSFSPLINSLVPFYKKNSHILDIPKQYKYHEFPCIINIPYPNNPHNRKQLFDTELDPILLNGVNENNWITLVHHGYQDSKDLDSTLRYDLYFYKDDYEPNPEDINVLAQIKTSGNENQFKWYIDSKSIVFLGKIKYHMTASLIDEPLLSVNIKTIIDQDSTQKTGIIDGILCRFGILSNTKEEYNPIYYTLETNSYEKGNTVGIFEWVISTEQNCKGDIIYRKTVYLEPDNNPYENI